MRLIDADELLPSISRLIEGYKELMDTYKSKERYSTVARIENQIEGMRMVESLVHMLTEEK